MKSMRPLALSVLLFGSAAQADDVTYHEDIRPLWEKQCMACHGASSPTLAGFDDNKDKYKKLMRGPRMDSSRA